MSELEKLLLIREVARNLQTALNNPLVKLSGGDSFVEINTADGYRSLVKHTGYLLSLADLRTLCDVIFDEQDKP